jgi:hypothetical protein
MWGEGKTGGNSPQNYRNDLKAISDAVINLIRLFNWGPTRGWNGIKGDGHIKA